MYLADTKISEKCELVSMEMELVISFQKNNPRKYFPQLFSICQGQPYQRKKLKFSRISEPLMTFFTAPLETQYNPPTLINLDN